MQIERKEIENILKNDEWDFGNNLLYDLCSKYPLHNKKEIVIAKILFIGRIYAAAIERRKNKNEDSDTYYIKKVAPTLIKSRLDHKLNSLNKLRGITEKNVPQILETHYYLSKLFYQISGLNKRSLSSKYLHFHKPNLFFIYDSRAVKALGKLLPRYKLNEDMKTLLTKNVDKDYVKFCLKSLVLKSKFEQSLGREISLREYDKILIHHSSK